MDLLAAIYVITKPINEHSKILPPVVSRTLWITGILFPFVHWVWNSISYGLRDHTQPLFIAQSSCPCFRQHTVAGATWSEDQRRQLRQTQIQNLYLLIMFTSAHANYEAFNNSALPWLVALHSIIKSGWQTGRKRHESDHQWRNLWMISEIIFMLRAFLLHSLSLTFKWLYLFALVSRCRMDRVVWEAWQSKI